MNIEATNSVSQWIFAGLDLKPEPKRHRIFFRRKNEIAYGVFIFLLLMTTIILLARVIQSLPVEFRIIEGIIVGACSILLILISFRLFNAIRIKGQWYRGGFDSQLRTKLRASYTMNFDTLRRAPRDEALLWGALLRHWGNKCDNEHQGYRCPPDANYWPTRVLFVGARNAGHLKLVETHANRANLPAKPDYLTLSHRWGDPTEEEKRQFCTTPDNYQQRLRGFDLADLPQTFKDAIDVTRILEKRYLWIDALCVIQSNDDNESDWKEQAGYMEKVFSSAYLTIAATSAKNWKEGFLTRENGAVRFPRVQIWQSSLTYPKSLRPVRRVLHEFQTEVDNGLLNQRAWILQERILSRRILHFTEYNIYWECGNGVSFDDLTTMQCQDEMEHFLHDPAFPKLLKDADYHAAVLLIVLVFQKYSRCELTKIADKHIAIRSLLRRMKNVFDTECKYGVFAKYLPRLLAWRRLGEDVSDRITVLEDNEYLPSWTWLTFSHVEFLPATQLEIPLDNDLRFDSEQDNLLHVQIRELRGTLEFIKGRQFNILDSNFVNVGEVWFDSIADASVNLCVVLGRANKKSYLIGPAVITYFVLIVRQRPCTDDYTRIGLGRVGDYCVAKDVWRAGQLF